MANVKLIFQGTENTGTNEVELQCYSTSYNNIYISIKDYECGHDYSVQHICLDKETAIKLHRELKKHISFLESEGGQNG